MAACRNPSLALAFVAVIHIRTAGTWHAKFGKEVVCSKYCKCLYVLYVQGIVNFRATNVRTMKNFSKPYKELQ
jgi:hypothetical protein